MKNMSKKILSMALVIAMVLSLVPMSFAAGEEATSDVTIVYDILSKVSTWGDTTVRFDSADYVSTNGFWQYAANSVGADTVGNGFNWNKENGLYLSTKQVWWAMKIKVPKTADYTPSMIYTTLSAGNTSWYVYLVSAENYTDETIGNVTKNASLRLKKDGVLASINSKWADGETENQKKNMVFDEITLPEGEYYLLFENGRYSGQATISNFTLVEGNGNGSALMGGKISGVSDTLEIGDTATATASAFLSKDGSEASNFTYSSDSSAITIDESTGELTANAAGSATITAISADAVEGYNTITKKITVTAPLELTIKYDILSKMSTWGDTTVRFDSANYVSTNGFWDYATNSTNADTIDGSIFNWNQSLGLHINGKGTWWAVKIMVPKTATYTPNVTYGTHKSGKSLYVYLVSAEDYTDETIGNVTSNANLRLKKNGVSASINCLYPTGETSQTNKNIDFDKIELPAGEYYLVYEGDQNTGWRIVSDFTLTAGNGDGSALMGGAISGVSDTLEIGDTATVVASAYLSKDGSEASNFTYSSDSSAITIDAETGALTANTAGTATIIATSADAASGCNTITKTVKVNPEQDPDLIDAFNDAVKADAPSDYIAPTVSSIDATGIVGNPVLQADGSYKITAPETNEDGEVFLYWKKAMTTNEKIISLVREFNYVPEGNERNILVAVYEGDITSTSPKCYNANGQYIPDAQPIDADLPSMAGYNKAYKWEQYKDTNVWVAQYKLTAPESNIKIHIGGGDGDRDGTNATKPLAAYGDPIICTTTDAHKELYGAYFKFWKRVDTDGTETILSRNEEYSFNAWESCEIEGVYSSDPVNYNGPTIKILIDSFVAGEETGVMAEFLGFGSNVVEKGIMFNGNRIAMTAVGNQFSVIADKPGTYVGYAIVRESDGLKLITDGLFTVPAAE